MVGPEGDEQAARGRQEAERIQRELEHRILEEQELQDDEPDEDVVNQSGGKKEKLRGSKGLRPHGLFRPIDELSRGDIVENFDDDEKEQIKDELRSNILGTFYPFAESIRAVVEQQSGKKAIYSIPHAEEYAGKIVAQTLEAIQNTKSENNEILLGAVHADQVVVKSMHTIYNWAGPYLSMYWAGMDSMRLIMERGMQLPMADMTRLFKGPSAKWVKEGIKKLDSKEQGSIVKNLIPLRGIGKNKIENGTKPVAEIKINKEDESFGERMGRYTADTYFWTQIRGEMNTYNPTYGEAGLTRDQAARSEHESLYISETMQQFVKDISNPIDRNNPDTGVFFNKKVKIYFDENGTQIPEVQANENTRSVSLFTETLDFFNKMKTEKDRKWVIATTAAMAMHNAKEVLDGLPIDIMQTDTNSNEYRAYVELFKKVKTTAIEIVENFDSNRQSFLEHNMAKTAFDLSYAFAFGSFSVADWGWSYEWSYKGGEIVNGGKPDGKGIWSFEGAQGDPTASGDAFTARRPFFHEVVYAAIKDRASAPKGGTMMAIDGATNGGEKAYELANALLSDIEQANQRGKMIERIRNGEQPHLARFFGVLGAYSEVLGTVPAYKEGVAIRDNASRGLEPRFRKEANKNLIKTIEKLIVYVPTPFKDKSGKNLIYPMVMPQFEIGLLDMLRAKKYADSAGDLLRKTWIPDGKGGYVEESIEKGGRRLTMQKLDWEAYGAYADDSRAVNDNFMSQLYTPLFGAPNPKGNESIVSNPAVAIGLAVKAADLSTRQARIDVDDSITIQEGDKGAELDKKNKAKFAQRPSLEIIYACSDIFQGLALGPGGYGLIGRGSISRLHNFIKDITVEGPADRQGPNLYMILRNVEDLLPAKQGYEHYSDSFYLLFLGMLEAIKPISIATDDTAVSTTTRMESNDTLGDQKLTDTYKNRF